MSLGLPQPVFTQTELPNAVLSGTTFPTATPTTQGQAHGRVPDSGRVMVEVSAAVTLTLYVWSPMSATWTLPASASSGYQKTFAAAGMDYFDAPVGCQFYLYASGGGISGWLRAEPNGASSPTIR